MLRAFLFVGLAGLAGFVEARVTHSTVLCLPASGPWLSPEIDQQLRKFGANVIDIARQYGTPEVVITSSISPQSEPAPWLERPVIQHLRDAGVALGPHESVARPREARPQDFGCQAHEVALEIEAVFWHPIYR